MADAAAHKDLVKDSERVAKKQKLSAQQAAEGVQALMQEVERTRAALAAAPDADVSTALQELQARVKQLDVAAKSEASHKELYACVGKLGKTIERCFPSEATKPARDINFDQGVLNRVITQHLYREGHFDLGDVFGREAGVSGLEDLKAPFATLHDVLREMATHNLEPALRWAEAHRPLLSPDGRGSALEFVLHKLTYLRVLTSEGRLAAVAYARQHFGPFRDTAMRDIQRLACSALYVDRLADSPYADLLAPSQWTDAAAEFRRCFCAAIGAAPASPLAVTVNAGAVALPTLTKLAAVLAGKGGGGWVAGDQLPVEIELGREFTFHSIFACPVSREQSTADNPPMLLPCAHVLAKQTVMRLAKGSSKSFKCPYCPSEATAAQCRQLTF